jgi:hypothetical protein
MDRCKAPFLVQIQWTEAQSVILAFTFAIAPEVLIPVKIISSPEPSPCGGWSASGLSSGNRNSWWTAGARQSRSRRCGSARKQKLKRDRDFFRIHVLTLLNA